MQIRTTDVRLPSVEVRELFTRADGGKGRAAKVDGRRAIVNADTGQLYNIITNDYQFITHQEVLERTRTAIMANPEYGDVTERVTLDGDGARMSVGYRFGEVTHAVRFRGKKDVVNPTVDVKHSYDGSWALRGVCGAFRLVCKNGLTVMEKFVCYRREHHQPSLTSDWLTQVT